MADIKEWVSEHKVLAGSLVLGTIVLYFAYSSSGATGPATASNGVGGTGLSSSDYASLQEAQLESGTELAAQTNQVNAQNYQVAAELQATSLNAQVQDNANKLAAQTQLQNIVTSGQVQEQTNSTALQSVQAQIGGQVQIAGIGAQENETIEGIQSQALEDQYADAIQSQNIISTAQTKQAQINADTQNTISGYAAGVQLASINQQNNTVNQEAAVDLANIQANLSKIQAGAGIISSGTLNKGGSGGSNQTSAFQTLFGG